MLYLIMHMPINIDALFMESKYHTFLLKAGFTYRGGAYNLKKEEKLFYYSHTFEDDSNENILLYKMFRYTREKQTSSFNKPDETYEYLYSEQDESFEHFVIRLTDSHLNFLEQGDELRGAASIIDTGLF